MNLQKRQKFIKDLLFFVLIAALNISIFAMRITFIKSDNSEEHDEIIVELQNQIKQKLKENIEMKSFNILDYSSEASYKTELLTYYPNYIFTFGDKAAMTCQPYFLFPFIYGGVYNPVSLKLVDKDLKNLGNWTGVSFYCPPKNQINALLNRLPFVKTIGFLYSEETQHIMNDFESILKSKKIETKKIKIKKKNEVSKKFRKLAKNRIDAFILLPDQLLLDDYNLDYIIKGCRIWEVNCVSFTKKHKDYDIVMAVYPDIQSVIEQILNLFYKVIETGDVKNIDSFVIDDYDVFFNEKNVFNA